MSGELLQVDWETLFYELGVDECFAIMKEILWDLVGDYVPLRGASRQGKWLVKPTRAITRERAALWHDFKVLRSELGRNHVDVVGAYETYRQANIRYKNYALNRQCAHEKKLVSLLSVAPKAFHSYLRERKKGCPSVGPLKDVNGALIASQDAMCDAFAEAFVSVYIEDDPSSPATHQTVLGEMENLVIDSSSVYRVLQGLDSSSSPGPDGLHPMIFKSCAAVLSAPVAIICRKSLDQGTLPEDWKLSRVVPIFKCGSKADPLNYRPVSLTATCCKIMERVVVEHIVNYLEANSVLSDRQFGFRQGHSAEDQLLRTYGDVVACVDGGGAVDMVYLDFTKAFDVVNHRTLLQKLWCLGFSRQLLIWIEAFLVGRRMFVSVGKGNSSLQSVRSGVPQGSVLGPMLFLVYVNCLAENLECSWFAYADDFKLYCRCEAGRREGRQSLQRDIDSLSTRAASWNLKLNPNKCVVLRFGVRESLRGEAGSGYFLEGRELVLKDSHKDLGVTVDSSLRFHDHIREISRKATGLVNQILRATVCRQPDFMLSLFISHIRPLMDFGSVLWNVGYVGDVMKLERVQRRWTREIEGMDRLTYGARLRRLSLFSIYGRLLRSDLIKLWKAFNPVVDVQLLQLLERQSHRATRGNGFKLSVPRCHSELRRRFWSVRCVRLWNRLPSDIVGARSVEGFKARLDSHMGDRFFKTINET